MDAAACIGCELCAACQCFIRPLTSCHLGAQGKPERDEQALGMVAQMNVKDFGSCTNIGECQAAVAEGDPAGSGQDHEPGLCARASTSTGAMS